MNICNVIYGSGYSIADHKCQCNKFLFGICYHCFSGTILQITCNIQSRLGNIGKINIKKMLQSFNELIYLGPSLYDYHSLIESLANRSLFM